MMELEVMYTIRVRGLSFHLRGKLHSDQFKCINNLEE